MIAPLTVDQAQWKLEQRIMDVGAGDAPSSADDEIYALIAAVRAEERQQRQALVDALRALVEAVEHKDNPYDMGVFSGDDVMKSARAALVGEPV